MFLKISGYNTVEIVENTAGSINEESVVENAENVKNEISEVENKLYYARMRRNTLVHVSKYDLNLGDTVIIKRDFDTNVKTKRRKLDSFYSDPCFINEMCSNNRALVKFDNGNEEMVSLIQLKKVPQ